LTPRATLVEGADLVRVSVRPGRANAIQRSDQCRRRVLGLFAAIALHTPHLRAEDGDEPVRFVYRAPNGCPGEASFLAQVKRRTTRVRAPRDGEPAHVFTVTIDGGVPSRGQLAIENVQGSKALRVVEGDHCVEVAYALAFAAALAIDPAAGGPPEPPRRAPSVAPVPAPPRAAPPPSKKRSNLGLGGKVSVSTLVAPTAAFGGELFVESSLDVAPGFWPSLRLAVSHSRSREASAGAGQAHFTRWTGGLEACPTRWPLGSLRAFLCGRFDAGLLRGQGSGLDEPKASTATWVALGPAAHLRWVVGDFFFVEVDGSAIFPLTHPRFFFQPDSTIYEVPAVGAEGGLAIGLELR
jgi:hypothetical protein